LIALASEIGATQAPLRDEIIGRMYCDLVMRRQSGVVFKADRGNQKIAVRFFLVGAEQRAGSDPYFVFLAVGLRQEEKGV
jgi:hypothetical protein